MFCEVSSLKIHLTSKFNMMGIRANKWRPHGGERETDRPVTGSVSVYSDSDDSDSFGDTDLFSRASHFQHQPRGFGGHRGGQGGHRGYPGPHPPFMFPPPPPGPPPQDSELYITCKSWCLFQTKVTMTFRFLFNLRHG